MIEEIGSNLDFIDQFKDLGNDTIKFGAGISGSDLDFTIVENDLIIKFKNDESGQIIIKNQFQGKANRIENLEFADGKIFDITNSSSPKRIWQGSNQDDDITGSEESDLIIGTKGNDNLFGEKGDDTYIYNIGDGHDTIDENTSDTDNNSDNGTETKIS